MQTNDHQFSSEQRAEQERLERLATLLDASIKIPFTEFRIGLDSLIGLIPGIGDVASGLISLLVVYRGWRLGVGLPTVMRMLWNLLVDVIVGTIPIAGDVFDMVYKANLRNVALIDNALKNKRR